MIAELKKHWIFAIAFVVLNFFIFEGASIMAQPENILDIIAPMVFAFQLVSMAASFFAALIVSLGLFSKTKDFNEQLSVIVSSAVIFALLFSAINFAVLFSLPKDLLDQNYLDATYALPYEFTQEQFNSMTFLNALLQSFSVLLESTGGALLGLLFARKIMQKKK